MGRFESLHLTVITDKVLLEKIDKAGAVMFGKPDSHPLYGVPTLILVSSEKPEPMMENVVYSNAAMMVHNMALEATELEVGSCYIWGATMAISKNDEILNALKLPENFIPCCAIGLGKTECCYELRNIPDDKISKNFI